MSVRLAIQGQHSCSLPTARRWCCPELLPSRHGCCRPRPPCLPSDPQPPTPHPTPPPTPHPRSPRADIFLAAASQLGVHPDNCVVIEDAVAGVQAARAAGGWQAQRTRCPSWRTGRGRRGTAGMRLTQAAQRLPGCGCASDDGRRGSGCRFPGFALARPLLARGRLTLPLACVPRHISRTRLPYTGADAQVCG